MRIGDLVKASTGAVARFSEKNMSTILTGAGLIGFITAPFLAISDNKKAEKKYEKAVKEKGSELSGAEAFVVKAPCYIRTGVVMIASGASIVGGKHMDMKAISVLTGALISKDRDLKLLEDKMKETIGEKKANKVLDAVAEEKADVENYSPQMVLSSNSQFSTLLCCDVLSGQYFRASRDFIEKVIAKRNTELRGFDGTSRCSDYYFDLGIPCPEFAKNYAWHIECTRELTTEDFHYKDLGEPCLMIDWRYGDKPINDYEFAEKYR